jgi:hypothetical protein
VRRVPVLACACLALLGTLLAAGCGTRRSKPDSVDKPAAPTRTETSRYPHVGLRFTAPVNWIRASGQPPLVTTITSGAATVAIWRYPRSEGLPKRKSDMEFARDELIKAAEDRDKTLQVQSSKVLTVGGVNAVELVADETIGGARRRVRSTHLYDRGAEIVVDAYAPPVRFDRADREVFAPLVASLRIGAPNSP